MEKWHPLNTWFICFLLFQAGSCTAQVPQEGSDCIPQDSVTRIVTLYEKVADTLIYQGKLFTGCTVSPMASNSETIYQTVENGIVSRQYSYMLNGKLGRDFNFRNGKPHGFHAMYFEDGRLYIEEFYKDGVPIGTHRRWHKTGHLARIVVYEDGEKQSETLYDPQGIKIDLSD